MTDGERKGEEDDDGLDLGLYPLCELVPALHTISYTGCLDPETQLYDETATFDEIW
jgi:hypothetical protein